MKSLKRNFLKPIVYTLIFLCCILIFLNNNNDTSVSNELTSKEVIEKYFYYYNARSKRKILTTMTPWHRNPNMVFGFKNLEYIKIIDIEDENLTQRDTYMDYGGGKRNGIDKENVKVHRVWFESQYSKPNPPWTSGKDWSDFVLIREDESSPWLIDDMGE